MGKTHTNRRCPKCGGTMFFYSDYYGWYEQCLQCSYTLDLDVMYENKSGKKSPVTVK